MVDLVVCYGIFTFQLYDHGFKISKFEGVICERMTDSFVGISYKWNREEKNKNKKQRGKQKNICR